MKETTSVGRPPCFHRWCDRFNNVFKTKAQKTRFREYSGYDEAHSIATDSSGNVLVGGFLITTGLTQRHQ